MENTNTTTGTGESAVHIGILTIDGESFPLMHGRNEIRGEIVDLRDTHHFAYANMDHGGKGWNFEPCKEWAQKMHETSSAIYWSSVNPWSN